jgi:hypothetical protein
VTLAVLLVSQPRELRRLVCHQLHASGHGYCIGCCIGLGVS